MKFVNYEANREILDNTDQALSAICDAYEDADIDGACASVSLDMLCGVYELLLCYAEKYEGRPIKTFEENIQESCCCDCTACVECSEEEPEFEEDAA